MPSPLKGSSIPMALALGAGMLTGPLPAAAAQDPGGPAAAVNRGAAAAAAARPLPYPLSVPPEFRRAVANGTRTSTGEPGGAYWQQWTEYRLRARVLPDRKRLEGSAEIVYHNRSPDALPVLHLELTQNFHAPGAVRHEPAELTGGVEIHRVAIGGRQIGRGGSEGPRYAVSGTRLTVAPARPVATGASIVLEIDWAFTIPAAGAGGRMGWNGDGLFVLAYWYPQMAVYDDIVGWHPDPFLGTSEFYAGFGTYDVSVRAPAGWIVRATGRLENPEETLAPAVLERLRAAESSDTVVHVLTAEDFGPAATREAPDGWLEWRFRADSVRDVAFSATYASNWDAARTPVGDLDGDGATEYTRVEALYRESAPRWRQVARYAQHAIRFLSTDLAMPYPWPHMTAVEAGGIIGGGMEYPMMTMIGDYNAAGDSALYYVTAHELAHMWMPMLVSSDERRFSWMDEGATTFNENRARTDFFPGTDHHAGDRQAYIQAALAGAEGEIMRRSAYHYGGTAFSIASYAKPASVLLALRGVLGENTFLRAYRLYLRRWAHRHPYPWDLWNTFSAVSGRDLDWFWRTWYHETWTLDQAIAGVVPGTDGTRIIIEDRGLAPMPVHLTITRQDGEVIRRVIPVDTWLAGETTTVLTLPPGAPVAQVEIDADHTFPDVNRRNNVWRR